MQMNYRLCVCYPKQDAVSFLYAEFEDAAKAFHAYMEYNYLADIPRVELWHLKNGENDVHNSQLIGLYDRRGIAEY